MWTVYPRRANLGETWMVTRVDRRDSTFLISVPDSETTPYPNVPAGCAESRAISINVGIAGAGRRSALSLHRQAQRAATSPPVEPIRPAPMLRTPAGMPDTEFTRYLLSESSPSHR